MEKEDVDTDYDDEEKIIVVFLSAGFALYSLYSYFVWSVKLYNIITVLSTVSTMSGHGGELIKTSHLTITAKLLIQVVSQHHLK